MFFCVNKFSPTLFYYNLNCTTFKNRNKCDLQRKRKRHRNLLKRFERVCILSIRLVLTSNERVNICECWRHLIYGHHCVDACRFV